MKNQELLLHEQAVSDNGPRTARLQEFGNRSKWMREDYQQILHGRAGQGRLRARTRLSNLLFSGNN